MTDTPSSLDISETLMLSRYDCSGWCCISWRLALPGSDTDKLYPLLIPVALCSMESAGFFRDCWLSHFGQAESGFKGSGKGKLQVSSPYEAQALAGSVLGK